MKNVYLAYGHRATASLMVDVPYVSLLEWAQFFFLDYAVPTGMFPTKKHKEMTADKILLLDDASQSFRFKGIEVMRACMVLLWYITYKLIFVVIHPSIGSFHSFPFNLIDNVYRSLPNVSKCVICSPSRGAQVPPRSLACRRSLSDAVGPVECGGLSNHIISLLKQKQKTWMQSGDDSRLRRDNTKATLRDWIDYSNAQTQQGACTLSVANILKVWTWVVRQRLPRAAATGGVDKRSRQPHSWNDAHRIRSLHIGLQWEGSFNINSNVRESPTIVSLKFQLLTGPYWWQHPASKCVRHMRVSWLYVFP